MQQSILSSEFKSVTVEMMVGATGRGGIGGDWSSARAASIIDQLATWSERQAEERIVAEKMRKVEAIAKAEAASKAPSAERTSSDEAPGTNWSVHEFQPWMTEEKHFASKTMATLQSQYAKTRKSRGRNLAGEPSCAHNILMPKMTKLTPQGAAEMARARMAAAEAAEAMRNDAERVDSGTRATTPQQTSIDRQLSERPSSEFDSVPYANAIFRMAEDPRYARRLSLTQYAMPEKVKVKKVEFTSDTIFEHPKRP